jgi:hypothetical protein
MMLIATSVAVALFASTAALAAAAAPEASSSAIPSMIVTVDVADGVSPRLASQILAEAAAIWRPAGVTFSWRRTARTALPFERASDAVSYLADTLRVTIGNNRGVGRDGRLPLGWITFDDVARPEQEIYVSHANALAMLIDARGVVGVVDQMPVSQHEVLLGRAMGRALAHELGHYLLASKVHTPKGLMKAALTAVELFLPDARVFQIEPAQRRAVAARLRGEPLVARR